MPGCFGWAVQVHELELETNMPKISEMYPSPWLNSADCEDQDLVLTIDRVSEEKIGQAGDLKWVVRFTNHDKGLILNKTNTMTIAKMYGEDTDDWEGKRITVFATEVNFQGGQVPAIRIRSKPPKEKNRPVETNLERPKTKFSQVDEDEYDSF